MRALLMVMGLIPALNLHATFGLIPLYDNDIWLHALLAAIAAYFGFIRRADVTTTTSASRGTVTGTTTR